MVRVFANITGPASVAHMKVGIFEVLIVKVDNERPVWIFAVIFNNKGPSCLADMASMVIYSTI
jgi:hypothetical protein